MKVFELRFVISYIIVMSGLEEVAKRISEAGVVVISTGAGMSAPSGVPTFRGEDGMWKNYRAEELATPSAFRDNPTRVWEWYNWRREIIGECEPNAGHHAIVEMEEKVDEVEVVTQNVDGLHDRAGSSNIYEVHGNIWRVRCVGCERSEYNYDVPLEEIPLRCECGELLRPDVVWFGESLNEKVLREVYDIIGRCDLFINAGTSSLVMPASQFPVIASRSGAFVVEINLTETPMSNVVDLQLSGDVSEILPALVELV